MTSTEIVECFGEGDMSGDEADKSTQPTSVAVQQMVSKVIESVMSSFLERIMKEC